MQRVRRVHAGGGPRRIQRALEPHPGPGERHVGEERDARGQAHRHAGPQGAGLREAVRPEGAEIEAIGRAEKRREAALGVGQLGEDVAAQRGAREVGQVVLAGAVLEAVAGGGEPSADLEADHAARYAERRQLRLCGVRPSRQADHHRQPDAERVVDRVAEDEVGQAQHPEAGDDE